MKVINPYQPDILVCEDDEQFRQLIEFILKRESLKVAVAKNGQEAVDFITDNPPVRLVILDIMMPFVDGFQVARHLRTNSRWKDIPLIMLSAKSNEKDIVKAFDEGATDFIVKPFQPAVFLARLKHQLRQTA